MSLVDQAWKKHSDERYMKRVWLKLKRVKHELKILNMKYFVGVDDKLKKIKENLQEVHEKMGRQLLDSALIQKEKDLKEQMETLGKIE